MILCIYTTYVYNNLSTLFLPTFYIGTVHYKSLMQLQGMTQNTCANFTWLLCTLRSDRFYPMQTLIFLCVLIKISMFSWSCVASIWCRRQREQRTNLIKNNDVVKRVIALVQRTFIYTLGIGDTNIEINQVEQSFAKEMHILFWFIGLTQFSWPLNGYRKK